LVNIAAHHARQAAAFLVSFGALAGYRVDDDLVCLQALIRLALATAGGVDGEEDSFDAERGSLFQRRGRLGFLSVEVQLEEEGVVGGLGDDIFDWMTGGG
jgi:hypothetical protein